MRGHPATPGRHQIFPPHWALWDLDSFYPLWRMKPRYPWGSSPLGCPTGGARFCSLIPSLALCRDRLALLLSGRALAAARDLKARSNLSQCSSAHTRAPFHPTWKFAFESGFEVDWAFWLCHVWAQPVQLVKPWPQSHIHRQKRQITGKINWSRSRALLNLLLV